MINESTQPNVMPILSKQGHYGSWEGSMVRWAKGMYNHPVNEGVGGVTANLRYIVLAVDRSEWDF